ncbi:FRG domain-containing protein [Cupriavidus basilensis]|uniref:FRG domain-containing protein n=1 Tax=Cupriavidus basilensis TaxID=68895 RepID=UPI000B09D07D|nr:FRG domain-containing protein [Cupriavidus basilensis]
MSGIETLSELRRRKSALGRRLGPFEFFYDSELPALSQLKSTFATLRPSAPVITSAAGQMTIAVESAEAAFIFLKGLQTQCCHSPGTEPGFGGLAGPLLFRGMRDESWDIETSIARVSPNERAAASHLTDAFSRLTATVGHGMAGLRLPPSSYVSVAQHYGFKTSLLDFTPDPEVAVFFACQEGSMTQGVVYFQNINRLLDQGLRILLAPPLFKRIEIQRGVFVDTPGVLSKSLFNRIVFPSNIPLTVFRNGEAVDLLSMPDWIADASAFVETWAPGKVLDSFSGDEWEWDFYAKGPTYDPVMELARWLDFYEDARYWLAGLVCGSEEAFLPRLVNAIAHDNPELASLHDELQRLFGKPT